MADIKQTVTERETTGVDDAGANVEQRARQVHTEASADSRTTASNLVWYLLGVIEILLALRFILKLFGANPNNGFVDFVYGVSGVLTAPFDNIFNVASAQAGEIRSVFEPSILVAALVYALIAWGVVKLINIDRPTTV